MPVDSRKHCSSDHCLRPTHRVERLLPEALTKQQARPGGYEGKEVSEMLYTLEKRHEFGGGTMSTYYGLFKYEKRYANGILANGKLVRRFTKRADGLKYCDRYGIKLEEESE